MLPEKYRDTRKIKLVKCCLCREEKETKDLIIAKTIYTQKWYCVECNLKRMAKNDN